MVPDRGAEHVIGVGIAIGIAVGAVLTLLAVSVFGTTGVSKARRIRDQLRIHPHLESTIRPS